MSRAATAIVVTLLLLIGGGLLYLQSRPPSASAARSTADPSPPSATSSPTSSADPPGGEQSRDADGSESEDPALAELEGFDAQLRWDAADPDEEEASTDDWPEAPQETPSPTISPDGGASLSLGTRLAVEQTASTFAKKFARQSDPAREQEWWNGIEPYFTDQAAEDFLNTDPSQIPYTAVVGPASVRSVLHEGLAVQVDVPTDIGGYVVIVTVDDRQPSGWAVMTIVPQDDDQVWNGA